MWRWSACKNGPPPEMAGSKIHDLLAAHGMVAAPGVGDPFSARLVERVGFKCLYLGGNALGVTLAKGQPLITLTETVDCAARIVRTSRLPLIVDAGAGFGAPPHVHRTVLEIESTGAAALHIDDQPYPKRPSYHRGKGGLASLEEAAQRIAVAVRARRDPDFPIFARTDAYRATGSIDETVRRSQAYLAAGADGLVLLDVERQEDLVRIRAALPKTILIWIGGVQPPIPAIDELQHRGFDIALYPFNTVAAIAQAVTDLWTAVRDTGHVPQTDTFITRMRKEISVISGMETYWKIEDEIARSEAKSATGGDPS